MIFCSTISDNNIGQWLPFPILRGSGGGLSSEGGQRLLAEIVAVGILESNLLVPVPVGSMHWLTLAVSLNNIASLDFSSLFQACPSLIPLACS